MSGELQGTPTEVEMDFPVLAEYVNDNNIAVSTKEDLVSILLNIPTHYNSPIYCSPIYYYFSVLSHRCSTDSRAKAELVKVFSMAPGNESLTDLLLMHLIKGGGHNDEQFIHRVGNDPELFNAMITFLKKIECTPEQLKKLLETYHQRDNGSTYYRYHVYHALQLSNNLDVSTSTLERHIDVLPPSHIEWLASRIRFGWDSFGRDLYHGYTPSQEINKKVNEHFGSNIAPTTTQNKWHYAKLVRVCVNALRAIYPKAFAEYVGENSAEKEQDAISACGDLLHSLIGKYGKGVTNEDVRQVASKEVFDKINLSDSTYLHDTIRDVVVRPFLLPQVLSLVAPEKQEVLMNIKNESLVNKIEDTLIKDFAKYLFKSHDLVTLSLLTKKAHERLGTIEKTRDIPRQGDWYSFLVEKKVDLGEYSAVVVDNASDLQVEGVRNNTCLGGFVGSCLAGSQHVLVFRDKDSNSIGYVRLSIREYKKEPDVGGFNIRRNDSYGEKYAMYSLYLTNPGNKPPSDQLQEAFSIFRQKIEAGELRVNANRQGKIEHDESIGSFLNRVGFDWNDPEKVERNYNILTARNGNLAGDSFAVRVGGGKKKMLIATHDKQLSPKEFVLKYKIEKDVIKKIEKKL